MHRDEAIQSILLLPGFHVTVFYPVLFFPSLSLTPKARSGPSLLLPPDSTDITKADSHGSCGTFRTDSDFPISRALPLWSLLGEFSYSSPSWILALILATEEGKKINYWFHGLQSLKIFKVSEPLPREVQRRNSSTGLFHSQTSLPRQSGASEGRLSTEVGGWGWGACGLFTANLLSVAETSPWCFLLTICDQKASPSLEIRMDAVLVPTAINCGAINCLSHKMLWREAWHHSPENSLLNSEAVVWVDHEEEAGISREVTFPMLFLMWLVTIYPRGFN